MQIDIHIHHDPALGEKLGRIVHILEGTQHMVTKIDTELAETRDAIGVMTTAVQHAASKFSDLAAKLQAAIDALKQQGLTPAQLAEFDSIQAQAQAEAAALTSAADTADPDAPPPPPQLPLLPLIRLRLRIPHRRPSRDHYPEPE